MNFSNNPVNEVNEVNEVNGVPYVPPVTSVPCSTVPLKSQISDSQSSPCVDPPTFPPHPSTTPTSQLPKESDSDYYALAAWLQLPPPRTLRKAAEVTGFPLRRLRRLHRYFDWPTRAREFDHARARKAAELLNNILNDVSQDIHISIQQFRTAEYRLYKRIIDLCDRLVDQVHKRPRACSIHDICRLYELGFTLARCTCGMPLPDKPRKPEFVPPCPSFIIPEEVALKKAYGHKIPPDPPPSGPQTETP